MTDESGVSPTLKAAGQNPSPDTDLFAVDDYSTLGVAGGVLLVGRNTGGQMLVQPEVETVLQHCRVFRTLEAHGRHLVSLFPQLGGNVEDAVRVLAQVRQAGLFVSASALCQRLNERPDAAASLDRTKAFIITCDRPAAVTRLLESLLHNAQIARQKQLYLVDDSRDNASAEKNREAVEQFNLASPTSMIYFGAEEQRQLMAELEATLPEHQHAVRFLLDREHWGAFKTYGRSRTICLLLSVGERCVVMDDDVLCEALRMAPPMGEASLSDGKCQAAFFESEQQWRQQWHPTEFDPLVGHARCLGLDLGAALSAIETRALQPADLFGVSASLFQGAGSEAPVLVTQSGTLGDPGTRDNAWLVNLPPESVRGMLAVPGGLHTALTTRQCWLGQPRPAVSKHAVMSQVTGLDNRRELPPYFPALRGEDQLFGAVVDFLFPESVVLEYDWAVPHLPLEERRGNPAGDPVVPRGGLQMVCSYLAEARPSDNAVGYATRLQLASGRLRELSELSTGMLLARFRAGLTRAQGFALQTLNDRLAEYNALAVQDTTAGVQWKAAGAQWKEHLEHHIQQCIAALQVPANLSDLGDAPAGADNERVADHIRRAAAGYAGALEAWPAIRAAARRILDDQGVP